MTRSHILRPDVMSLRDRGGGISSDPLVTRQVGTRAFLDDSTILAPGVAVPRHWHNCDESVAVLAGQTDAEIDGVEHDLCVGEVTLSPTGLRRRFRRSRRR